MGVQSLLELEYEPLHARERKISRMGFVRGRDVCREREGEERVKRAKDGAIGVDGIGGHELWRDRVKFHVLTFSSYPLSICG